MNALKFVKEKLSKVLDLSKSAPAPNIPAIAILASSNRSGLSATKTTYDILESKRELGLPVGDYEDGTPNENDLIIYAIVNGIFKAIQEEAKITVAIQPGTQLQASGANLGGPIQVIGTTINIANGGAIIQ